MQEQETTADKSGTKVNSVVKAIGILRHLAQTQLPEGVNAIARQVGINPSSCFNILKTLASEEFVRFDKETKTYSLGVGVIDLAVSALDPDAGFQRTRPILERLAREHGVTCGLWRKQEDRLILLGTAESESFARIRFTPGNRLPMYIGAMGRCFIARAGMGEAEIDKTIASLKWASAPPLSRYLGEVRRAAVAGYAVDDGDFLQGITSVATPLISREGSITHCIAATTFKGHLDTAGLKRLGEAVKKASEKATPLLWSVR
ncbi:transcriptional regulator [Novosphingobium endophyticum]|uniref:Transcriptional regulator n=2 Tax=Novosphingobium endophyticum TaxID=1955250 RepID=A0A916TSH9_9SPHN|nr:transcriptional regulator [Novosphingobium endophyticum]